MKNQKLDRLVDEGQISEYRYRTVNDTNRNDENIVYEELFIVFGNGEKLTITSTSDRELSIE